MNPIPPDAATINAAKHQRDDAIIHGTFTFAGAAAGYGVLRSALPSLALDRIVHFGTGFHFDPLNRLRLPEPTSALKLYLLPAPVGVIPPELYGLKPDYVKDYAPSLPQKQFLATATTKERNALFEAEQEVEKIIARATGPKGQSNPIATRVLLQDLAYLHGLGAPVGEQFLAPPRSELALRTIEQELIRRDVIVPLRVIDENRRPYFGNAASFLGTSIGAGAIQTAQTPRPVANLQPVIPQLPQAPLPIDTPPPNVLVAAAARTANDVVRQIESERADP